MDEILFLMGPLYFYDQEVKEHSNTFGSACLLFTAFIRNKFHRNRNFYKSSNNIIYFMFFFNYQKVKVLTSLTNVCFFKCVKNSLL